MNPEKPNLNPPNNPLLSDPNGFTVDKAAKTVWITRTFAAALPLVWDTFTKPEILDK